MNPADFDDKHSRLAQRLRRRYAGELARLPAGSPTRQAQNLLLTSLLEQLPTDVATALRITRQLVLERLLTLDCAQALPLAGVTQAMTDLAELTLDTAYQHADSELRAQHGAPLNPQGAPAGLCILGMGKLGARELNVSSDIDLIYVFDSDGQTAGVAQPASQPRGVISNQEYFGKLVRAMQTLIGSVTEHGFVFRVDLALRPNGNSGPNAISLDALEDYFQIQGREWERLAWLKARVVAPQTAIGSPCARALRALVTPLSFAATSTTASSTPCAYCTARSATTPPSAAPPTRSAPMMSSCHVGASARSNSSCNCCKLCAAGSSPSCEPVPRSAPCNAWPRRGCCPRTRRWSLARPMFLRQVEHRIQYLDDQQTHVLPTDAADLQWIAHSLGLADSAALSVTLHQHRERVAKEFDGLLGGSGEAPATGTPVSASTARGGLEQLLAMLEAPAHADLHARLALWRTSPRVAALRDDARERLWRLLLRTAQWLHEGEASVSGCVALLDWMESILRRESYLALLLERPRVHARLLRLLGAARWPARYLLKHPGVIDELATVSMLDERFDAAAFTRELEGRYTHLRASGQDDEESPAQPLAPRPPCRSLSHAGP
jgi:glutamate-ammonia-ligase adenylyltransferase